MFFFGIPYTHVFTLEPGTLLSHTLKKIILFHSLASFSIYMMWHNYNNQILITSKTQTYDPLSISTENLIYFTQ